jgi:hypothetical protein
MAEEPKPFDGPGIPAGAKTPFVIQPAPDEPASPFGPVIRLIPPSLPKTKKP